MTYHATHLVIPGQWDMTGKEVLWHILQPFHHHRCLYRLIATMPIWCQQISIEVSGDEELSSLGFILNHYGNALQGGGVVQLKVSAHHIPVEPSNTGRSLYLRKKLENKNRTMLSYNMQLVISS